MNIVDKVAPMTEFTNNYTSSTGPQTVLKPLINKKQRLLKQYKKSKQMHVLVNIKDINKIIVDKCKQWPGPASTVVERPLRKISSEGTVVRYSPQDNFSVAIT